VIRVLSTNRTYTVCQACKAGQLAIDDINTLGYFANRKVSCPKCGNLIDWWDQILWQIQCQVPCLSLAPAGAFDTWLTITMKPREVAKLDLVVIPANVAVESKLNRMLSQTLSAVVSNERVDRFLTDAATYGHQLNVLLPFVTSIMGLPELPNHVRGILNKLKKNRNELAHKGKLAKGTTEQDAAEYLCAAFFSFVYMNQLDLGLSARLNEGKSALP
jgi:hypothetical protein